MPRARSSTQSNEPSRPDSVPRKIAFCHIDSLCGLPALNALFAELGDEIGLVLSSKRFASRHGGFWQQATAGFRRYGVALNVWLGFDLISVAIVGWFARLLKPSLATLPALAQRHGAAFIETPDINAAATMAAIRAYAPDFIVVMNFDQILQPPVIALPRIAAVNVHPALLPRLRGPCPDLWAIARGLDVSGATVHAIEDQTIDAGRVLARVEVPIEGTPSVGELNTRLFREGARIVPAALAKLEGDRGAGEPQTLAAGEYVGYPTAAEMARLRRAGLKLCRIGHAIRLIAAALGVARWQDHG
jgi:folate-dependent phosphoribosylglycinamide formyltransferase PurN